MTRSALLLLALGLVTPALADPTADARAVGEAFGKAMAAADVPAVLALYRDDASIIWPGQGEEGTGKAEIEKIVRATLASGPKDLRFVQKSNQARALGNDYIVNVGRWEMTYTTPRERHVGQVVRTSEVLQKTDGKWLYLVDHASIGTPPAPTRAHRRHPAP
jgi:uncharacterized protein (TIGR02246 family)